MWVPGVGLLSRLMLSALTRAGRFCILKSGAVRLMDVPAVNRRGLSDYYPHLMPSVGFGKSSSRVYRCRSETKRYITSPRVAETLVRILRGKRKSCQLFLECNPGPGILTRALLESGAKVIALESDETFIPQLKSLGKKVNGRLEVVYCDFFKLDPRSRGILTPPVMTSDMLFQYLGIEAQPWSKGAPLKAIGILPPKNERSALWKLLHDLYSCTSIYKYGRLELNLFITEKECRKIMANPQNPGLYQALSVLCQIACGIKLLHTESCLSFDTYTANGQLAKQKHRESLEQNLCFIQLTPHRNLFTGSLTPFNYDVFFHMLRQCFMKRNAKLIDHLHSLSPIDAMHILKQIKKNKDVKVIDMYPEDFQHLFETIECSKDDNYKWLYDDFMEDVII
ncbi:dimethyladenosine transferase 2, mitochondrial isoform X1 [Monodon monoceros]|uniref:rRNA adenine N(6)-methyltransferase n=2 Tax=Monodontidae TaxID=9747 RepID=A0A8C6ALP7_MONMO|nr:dimethyladenosine transferase 2, mitochondrial isoform X1 [Delphinapterus leucas]XP_029082959.1 dimethyladenosine transferase 2, mitochondrial isoform X1 [Monodon monoceros]